MKFSSVFVSFCSLAVLAGCAYVIPPENNAPRNNTVMGGTHRPVLNNGFASAAPSGDASQQASATGAPVIGDRRMPAENTPYQVSTNASYPSLTNVPPRPQMTGPDSAKARLNAVRSDLERDRNAAQVSRDALARDVAAEPSMLSPMPAMNAPAVSPLPPIVPLLGPQSRPGAYAAPTGPSSYRTAMDRESINFAPPAPLSAVATRASVSSRIVPAENPVDSASDIAMRDLPSPSMATISSAGNAVRPNVRKGDFDPLAVADNAPIGLAPMTITTNASGQRSYTSDGYFAASRYSGRRE